MLRRMAAGDFDFAAEFNLRTERRTYILHNDLEGGPILSDVFEHK